MISYTREPNKLVSGNKSTESFLTEEELKPNSVFARPFSPLDSMTPNMRYIVDSLSGVTVNTSCSAGMLQAIVDTDIAELIKFTESNTRICNCKPRCMTQTLDTRYDEVVSRGLKKYPYSIAYGVNLTADLVQHKLGVLNTALCVINSAMIRSGILVTKDEVFVGSLDELSTSVEYASALVLDLFKTSSYYQDVDRLEDGIYKDLCCFEPVCDGRTLSSPFYDRDEFYKIYKDPRAFIESVVSTNGETSDPFILFDTKNNILLEELRGDTDRSDAVILSIKQVPRLGQVFVMIEYMAMCYAAIAIEYQMEYVKVADDMLAAMLTNEDSEIGPDVYMPSILMRKGINDKFFPDGIDDTAHNTSTEAMPINESQKNININSIDENYKSKWLKLQKIYIENFKIKASEKLSKKNSKFFVEYYGRIPHLYEQYANRAPIYENTMNGDPTEILSTKAVEYVTSMSDDATQLFTELIGIAKRLASATDITTKLNIVKSYCKKFPIDDSDPYTLKKQINDETTFRIATSILRDVKIYGYTIEGIIENGKFPPANHIVTSLFVTNPHEKPFEQKVSDVFSSPESILVYAKPGEIVKFENLYRETSMKILNSFDHRSVSVAQKNMVQSTKNYGNRMKRADGVTNSETFDPKDQKKLAKLIESSVIAAIDMVVDQKQRCMQCVGVVHDMIARVTDLAMRCVVSMRNVEKENSDKNVKDKDFYNSGNEYKQHNKTQVKLDANKAHAEGSGTQDNTYRY